MALDYLDVNAAFLKVLMPVAAQMGLPFYVKGLPEPDITGKVDYLRFNLLEGMPIPDPNQYVMWSVELTITSLKAHLREDHKAYAPQEIWRNLKKYFHKARYKINNACIHGKETKVTHLDNRTVGNSFAPAAVTSPETETHTLLCNTIFIEISSKEDIHVW